MAVKKVTVSVDDKKLHLVLGQTYAEYLHEVKEDDENDDLWDFTIEELLDGTIEINEEIWYWCINGRCYETYEEV